MAGYVKSEIVSKF